ncbi:hypothetical protein [Nostoc sp. ChiVER01]|uniref:hypothetical protein n=1 Tax=Nostoc sp. ChiVER01 TaxID=3075382 RepID=UPI002AD43E8D|nr:hypothetical protein [Nostoc sp. ChiVER01]MDZ8225238.1 hypothetical protein [Nostoc sp. ChiVER01]
MRNQIENNRPLAKVLFARGEKGVHVKGEGDNTEPFPLPPYPFPDLCKKSNDNCLSIASVWEMVIKHSIGKLSFNLNFSEFVEQFCRTTNNYEIAYSHS